MILYFSLSRFSREAYTIPLILIYMTQTTVEPKEKIKKNKKIGERDERVAACVKIINSYCIRKRFPLNRCFANRRPLFLSTLLYICIYMYIRAFGYQSRELAGFFFERVLLNIKKH